MTNSTHDCKFIESKSCLEILEGEEKRKPIMETGANSRSFRRQVMFHTNKAQEFPDLAVVVHGGKKY